MTYVLKHKNGCYFQGYRCGRTQGLYLLTSQRDDAFTYDSKIGVANALMDEDVPQFTVVEITERELPWGMFHDKWREPTPLKTCNCIRHGHQAGCSEGKDKEVSS